MRANVGILSIESFRSSEAIEFESMELLGALSVTSAIVCSPFSIYFHGMRCFIKCDLIMSVHKQSNYTKTKIIFKTKSLSQKFEFYLYFVSFR